MSSKIDRLALRQSREQWTPVLVDGLSEEERNSFYNKKKAVDLYIDGVSPSKIEEITGIPSGETIRLVRRCTEYKEDHGQAGYSALLAYRRVAKKSSKMDLLIVEHPELKNFLLGNYFGDKKYTLEKGMNYRTLHTRFLEECLRIGIQDYEYPFTVKDKGYCSLTRYIKKQSAVLQDKAVKREGKDAAQKFLSTGYGTSNNLIPIFPYNIVQIDGHKIDLLYSVEVENEHGEKELMPATRAWLLAVIDVATRAIIGYHVSPYENYNQTDVMHALQNAIRPHEKIEFRRYSLHYPEQNDGFPSLVVPETEWACFDMVMLDNAKSHLAKHVTSKLSTDLKCVLNFGSVATPETRGIVERFFNTLETGGFHRLPGTTGSNSRDPKRNDPEKQAVKYKITYTDICELCEYLIAEYNNSANSALEHQTPLQVLSRRVAAGITPYIIPESEREAVEKMTFMYEERKVRGGAKNGTRAHINYMGVNYHAINATISMEYINQTVMVEVNPEDISKLKIYDKDGIFISEVIAQGEWGRVPHSVKTRQAYLKRKSKNLDKNTPFTPHLSELEGELRQNAKNSRRDRTKASIIQAEKKEDPNTTKQPATVIPIDRGKEKLVKKNVQQTNAIQPKSETDFSFLDNMSIEEAYERGLI